MPIQWREQLSVGHQATDDEHKHLVCLLNGLEVLLNRYPKRLALLAFLDEMAEEVAEHFENEETLMRSLRYPGYQAHRQAHVELKQELVQLRDGLLTREDHEGFIRGVIGLMAHLQSWLINHIIQMDKDYAAHIIKARNEGGG